MAIVGKTYLEHGVPVDVEIQWRTPRRGESDDLAARFPLLQTFRPAPRNVLVRRVDGTTVVRPFRGLRKPRHLEPKQLELPW